MKIYRLLWLLCLIGGISFGQTHTFPALDTNNTFTGSNTFSGPVLVKNLNNRRAASQFGLADCGLDISAAATALGSNGVITIDQNCPVSSATSAWSAVTISQPGITLLLEPGTYWHKGITISGTGSGIAGSQPCAHTDPNNNANACPVILEQGNNINAVALLTLSGNQSFAQDFTIDGNWTNQTAQHYLNNITSITGNGTTATGTCSATCNFLNGNYVTIINNANIGFNTVALLTSVSGTSFTFASSVNATGAGGTATSGTVAELITAQRTHTFRVNIQNNTGDGIIINGGPPPASGLGSAPVEETQIIRSQVSHVSGNGIVCYSGLDGHIENNGIIFSGMWGLYNIGCGGMRFESNENSNNGANNNLITISPQPGGIGCVPGGTNALFGCYGGHYRDDTEAGNLGPNLSLIGTIGGGNSTCGNNHIFQSTFNNPAALVSTDNVVLQDCTDDVIDHNTIFCQSGTFCNFAIDYASPNKTAHATIDHNTGIGTFNSSGNVPFNYNNTNVSWQGNDENGAIGPSATTNDYRINNQCLQWKNSGGTLECILNVDNTNNVALKGDSGLKTILFQSSPGSTDFTDANGVISMLGSSAKAKVFIADQGTACTNGELALSAGWQSTGSATVTAVAGTGQTCSWTITTGTTTAANPTVTDTLTNALPSASDVCEMNIHGGTHTAAAGEGFFQSALSATAPVFTFNGTPTAGGTTYVVTRRCGP